MIHKNNIVEHKFEFSLIYTKNGQNYSIFCLFYEFG